MDMVKIVNESVSRFILGSNPFSGYSHQGRAMDSRMRHFFTVERIKETLRRAETLGINTIIGRTDHHVMRTLMEYWDQGGKLQWFAQTCPGVGPTSMCVKRAMDAGAKACHIHGGVMDYLVAQDQVSEAIEAVQMVHDAGMPAGIAGHSTKVFEWAEEHLDVDYYMCCYYNPSRRDENPEHDPLKEESYSEQDRRAMLTLIPKLSKPVIHYKVLAAGRNNPAEAFAQVARNLRANDAVCVGIYTEKISNMLEWDVEMFEQALAAVPVK